MMLLIKKLTQELVEATTETGHKSCARCVNPITCHVSLTQEDQVDGIYLCDEHGTKLADSVRALMNQ